MGNMEGGEGGLGGRRRRLSHGPGGGYLELSQ